MRPFIGFLSHLRSGINLHIVLASMAKFWALAIKCIAVIVLLNYRHDAPCIPWNDKFLCRLYNRQVINISGN